MAVLVAYHGADGFGAGVLALVYEYEHAERHAGKAAEEAGESGLTVFSEHGAAINAAFLFAQKQHQDKPAKALRRSPGALYNYVYKARKHNVSSNSAKVKSP